jgi:glycosyltransferase involved in cell wall biosynthesis
MNREPKRNPHLPFVGIQHNVVLDYRLPFFRLLKKRFSDRFTIFAGTSGFAPKSKTAAQDPDLITSVRSIPLFNRRFIWQSGRFLKRLQADVLIANFNLRILSNYPILITRWILRKPSILWGHVTGRSSLTTRFGFLQYIFAKVMICYSETQCELFRQLHPRSKITLIAAPNSCVFQSDCYHIARNEEEIHDIIYVGRLISDKKPQLLLEAYLQAKAQGLLPSHVRLILVGSGPLESDLKQRAQATPFHDSVVFLGYISDINQLREIYSRAFCTINPGYVGLLLIQSYAFGIPVFSSRDEAHSPEIEAHYRLNFGGFFESNSVESLTDTLRHAWQNRSEYRRRQTEVIEYVRTHYTYEGMADGFEKAVQIALS